MIGSKLLPLLASMSSMEFRRMKKIFQSPFFTTNERHLILYELLRKYHPIFDTPKLNKEKVFEKLYPGKPLNDGLLRVIVREFTQMTEEYLLLLKLRKENFQRKKMLSQVYKDRNLYGFFEKETKNLLQDLENAPYRDWEYYREVYELNFNYFFHPNTQKLAEGDLRLMELMESMDKQFAFAKFRIGSEMKNRSQSFSKEYEIQLLDSVQELTDKIYQKENILFRLYALLFKLYNSEEKDLIFDQLKMVYSESFKKLRYFDQSLFLTQLINYTIRKINVGVSSFYKEALDLYKIGLEANMVVSNGSIDEAVYGNIVTLGCHAKEFEWVEEFMKTYKGHLKRNIREDAFRLNIGLWFFHQNDFENARDQFMNYDYSPKFQPKVRANLLLTLFEQFLQDDSLFDLLRSQMSSFEKHLHRNTIIGTYQKEAYLNFIFILRKLSLGIFNRKNLKKLRQNIENQLNTKDKVMGKTWLLEKIQNLKY